MHYSHRHTKGDAAFRSDEHRNPVFRNSPSSNLSIALGPLGLSNSVKIMVLLIFMAIKNHNKQDCLFSRLLEKAHFKLFCWLQKNFIFHSAYLKILIKIFYHLLYMFTNTHAKFEVASLASFSAMHCESLVFLGRISENRLFVLIRMESRVTLNPLYLNQVRFQPNSEFDLSDRPIWI